MTGSRLIVFTLLSAALAATVAGQGIPRGSRIATNSSFNRQRALVANPYVFAAVDSAASVQVGIGMRKRMDRIAGTDYGVVSDSIMNAALTQFGFWKDAILTPANARILARTLASRVLVTSTMSKGPGGNRQVVARLSGTNDDAGNVIRVDQTPGQSLDEFGGKVAEGLLLPLKSLADARACMDQRITAKAKASEAAAKSLKVLPGNGLAHYCLALIADSNHSQTEKVAQLEQTVAGDSLSVIALRQLAQSYQQKGDTAKAVATLQQILRAAPTDQDLRQSAFRYFLSSGNTDAAIQVADEGLKLDPYNWDLYDLKSNACLFAAKYACAVDVLAKAFQTDSSRADTLFFAKIGAASEQRLSDTLPKPTGADTATFLAWSLRGLRHFPTNITLLQQTNRAYSAAGQVDSSLAVTRRLMAVDSSNILPALVAAQVLLNAKRLPEALPYIDFALRRASATGDSTANREKAAGLLTNAAVPLLQPPTPDYKQAADLLRQAMKAAPTAPFAPSANYLLGLATFLQVPGIDTQAEKGKSCDMARQEDALLKESKAALQLSLSVKKDDAQKYLDYIAKYEPRVASMLKAYCK